MTGIISDNVGRTSGLIKAASGGGGGVWTKIKEQTASSSATISFVNGTSDVVLDSTYPIYVFTFIQVHPSGSGELKWNASSDTGSNYNVTKTNAIWNARNRETSGSTSLEYVSAEDVAQSTSDANFTFSSQIGTDNDSCASGEFWLFSPSNTTFVKHFLSRVTYMDSRSPSHHYDCHTAGYLNTTSAVDAIIFRMGTGNLDSGIFKLYGIGDS